MHHNFSQDLVDSVTETNGFEVFHPLGVLGLRNENNEGLIEFLQKLPHSKKSPLQHEQCHT